MNIITAPSIADINYVIGDPLVSYSIPGWKMSIDNCESLTTKVGLQGGGSLPSFIKHNSSAISVFSPLPQDAGTYLIKLAGYTTNYDESSTLST